MPTLTRAAAALLFAVSAFYLSGLYQLLYEDPRPVPRNDLFVAGVAGVVGWAFVGSRIGKAVMGNLFTTLQGVIVTVTVALALAAVRRMFVEGYKVRYRDLGEAIDDSLRETIVHLTRMTDVDFMIVGFALIGGVGLILSLLFRFFEGRRRS